MLAFVFPFTKQHALTHYVAVLQLMQFIQYVASFGEIRLLTVFLLNIAYEYLTLNAQSSGGFRVSRSLLWSEILVIFWQLL